MQTPINSSPAFAICMVNYKTLDLTRTALTLLKEHLDSGALDKSQVQVWVVDNDSKDESTQYLRTLDWIHLIERPSVGKEEGFAAHGHGLDLVLQQVNTDYLFLLHTDTFIYDPTVFQHMLSHCQHDARVVAVGCVHQLNRGYLRTAWRTFKGFIKFYMRKTKLALGLPAREPKPYIEPYIKSFCALWDIKLMRQFGYTFFMENRIPGYALQDLFVAQGYVIKKLSPHFLFQFLDHVEAGTVGLVTGYTADNRRLKRKQSMLAQLGASKDNK